MRRIGLAIVLAALLPLATGCWSKYELPERGFVMGAALDETSEGKIALLTQIYRPISAEFGQSATTATSSVNIKTSDDTVMEAIRDIPIHLGRKAQWSHLRVIIVGEKLARHQDLGKTLDLFFRDHEPRSSIKLLISKGPAYKIFEMKPLIEQTTAQQVLRTEEFSFRNSGKTVDTSLLDFTIQQGSANTDGMLSYIYQDPHDNSVLSSAGIALIKDGLLKTVLPPNKVEGLLMLRNEYSSGVLEIRCPGTKTEKETAEVLSLQTSRKLQMNDGLVGVKVTIKGELAISELKCSTIATVEDEKKVLDLFAASAKKQIVETLAFLQAHRMDVIGIGNQLYRHNPRLWAKLSPQWGDSFARAPFDIQIDFKLVTGGTFDNKPAS